MPSGSIHDLHEYIIYEMTFCWVAMCTPFLNVFHRFDSPPTIMISLDGFRRDYLDRGLTPNLQRLMDCGTSADYMRPAFPSLTFPNHYTLVTVGERLIHRYNDVMIRKQFPCYWPFVLRIHLLPSQSHKWGALIVSLLFSLTSCWRNSFGLIEMSCHSSDVIVMKGLHTIHSRHDRHQTARQPGRDI